MWYFKEHDKRKVSSINQVKKIQLNPKSQLQFVFIICTTHVLKVLKSYIPFVKTIPVELSEKEKYVLWIWTLRILNEGQDKFGIKKKMISVGFENNSGQSLLKFSTPYLINNGLEPSRVAFLSGIKIFVNSFFS